MWCKKMTSQDKFHAYGKISWLWANSKLHKSWSTAQQARFILPAVETRQYHIVEDNGVPVAYCSWAFITVDAEARFIVSPNSLQPEEWTSGDRLWFIDWVSPFRTKHTWELQRAMSRKFPDQVARAYRVKPKNEKARVATFVGTELARGSSHSIRRQLHADLVDALQSHPDVDKSFRIATS